MKSLYVQIVAVLLLAGLLSACGAQAVDAPTSALTQASVPATQAPTETLATTDTAAATEAAVPTEPPDATQSAGQAVTVSFADDVLPIIQSRCVNCHGGDRTEEGLNLTNHAGLMAGSEEGAVVIPGDAANSLLVELVEAQKMPKRGPKLTPPQVQVIADWVNQGALDN